MCVPCSWVCKCLIHSCCWLVLLLVPQVSAAQQTATLIPWQCSALPVPSGGAGQAGASSRWAMNPFVHS